MIHIIEIEKDVNIELQLGLYDKKDYLTITIVDSENTSLYKNEVYELITKLQELHNEMK